MARRRHLTAAALACCLAAVVGLWHCGPCIANEEGVQQQEHQAPQEGVQQQEHQALQEAYQEGVQQQEQQVTAHQQSGAQASTGGTTHDLFVGGRSSTRGTPYIYWNEVTGDTQETNPGGVPLELEGGQKYWAVPGTHTLLTHDPDPKSHVWQEIWNADKHAWYYLNQETQESSWERPVDLAWRLVKRPHLVDPYADL